MAGGARDDDDLINDINVTPLVDVALVLVIILMVTATAIASKTIPMEQPAASTTQSTEVQDLFAISVDADNKLYFDKEPVSMKVLRQRVKKAKAANNDVRALIAADAKVAHGKVIEVIDLLRQEQVAKLAFGAEPKKK